MLHALLETFHEHYLCMCSLKMLVIGIWMVDAHHRRQKLLWIGLCEKSGKGRTVFFIYIVDALNGVKNNNYYFVGLYKHTFGRQMAAKPRAAPSKLINDSVFNGNFSICHFTCVAFISPADVKHTHTQRSLAPTTRLRQSFAAAATTKGIRKKD